MTRGRGITFGRPKPKPKSEAPSHTHGPKCLLSPCERVVERRDELGAIEDAMRDGRGRRIAAGPTPSDVRRVEPKTYAGGMVKKEEPRS